MSNVDGIGHGETDVASAERRCTCGGQRERRKQVSDLLVAGRLCDIYVMAVYYMYSRKTKPQVRIVHLVGSQ